MSDETANLVLDLLRSMRADMQEQFSAMSEQFKAVNERLDPVETQVRGAGYIMTVSVGSLLTEVQDLKTRVVHLEGAQA